MSTSGSLTQEKSLEARIGLYWLHRLGIASLVLGFAFLMMYSFQYIGPVMKLLTGIVASIALIATGKLMATKDNSRWYGNGLIAGGWSLAYFTAYAAHFLPSVAVITSMPIETTLLIAVAGGSLASALRADSELMAIFSVTLAAATILLSGPGLFSDISFLVIAISASILGNRKSWTALFAWSMIACWAGHFYCSVQFLPFGSVVNPMVPFFLSALWLTFTVGSGYSVRTSDRARNSVTVLVCMNAAAFAAGLLIFNQGIMGRTAMTLAASGTVYLLMTKWLLNNQQEQLGTIHSLIGLALINCAKTLHYSGLTVMALDITQIAVLAIVGLKYNIKSFRWVAVVLACALFPLWFVGLSGDVAGMNPLRQTVFGFYHFEYVKIAVFAVSVLSALAYFCRCHAHTCSCDPNTTARYGNFFFIAANLMTSLAVENIIEPSWRALAWAVQGVTNHWLFVKVKDSLYFVIGSGAFVASVAFVGQNVPDWQSIPISLMILAFYATHGYVSLNEEPKSQTLLVVLKRLYAVTATILLTNLLFQKMPSNYLSLSLGMEGLLLLSAGFIARDGMFRLCGLIIMALLTGKLLFVDMANYNTLERIVSFIGAGFAFLFSSWAYARFTRAFEDVKEPADHQEHEEADNGQEVQEVEEVEESAQKSDFTSSPSLSSL